MKLVHVNARVQAPLEITRISNLFEIHTDEYVALEAFRADRPPTPSPRPRSDHA
jgi:hypothetical protein